MASAKGTCSIEGCEREVDSRGWCYMHYKRWWRHGHTDRLLEDHGLTATPEFPIWQRMRRRCFDPNANQYDDYGGRGITVCERWQSFSAFIEDMGPRPSPQHSIDRIDNDGPYSPENCRWATRAEQNRNKRTNVWLTLDGRTQVMTDWSEELGIPLTTIFYRKQRGLSDSEALNMDYRRRISR